MLASFAVAGLLVAVTAGLAGGLATGPESPFLLAYGHTELNLIDFGLVMLSAGFLAYYLAREERLAPLAGAAVAYELFLPLGAAAIGLLRAEPDLWQGAALTFALHLVWAIVVAVAVLAALGFRPLTGASRSLVAAMALMGLVAILSAVGLGASVMAILPTPPPTPTATSTPTETATITSTPTITPTATLTGAVLWEDSTPATAGGAVVAGIPVTSGALHAARSTSKAMADTTLCWIRFFSWSSFSYPAITCAGSSNSGTLGFNCLITRAWIPIAGAAVIP